jgi:hypothetical protein
MIRALKQQMAELTKRIKVLQGEKQREVQAEKEREREKQEGTPKSETVWEDGESDVYKQVIESVYRGVSGILLRVPSDLSHACPKCVSQAPIVL